jgi:hypothetical protein
MKLGPKVGHVVKVELEVVLQRAWPTAMCGRPDHGGEPTSLPRILSCHHMERYSSGRLDPIGYKVGPADHPTRATWQGLWPTGSTWSEVDCSDLGMTFC